MEQKFSLQQFITGLVIVGISLIVGIFIVDSIGSAIERTGTITGTITNETLTAVDNITNSTFSIKVSHSDATCNLLAVLNATDGTVIEGAGNYTYYSSACALILQDDSPYIGEDIDVTYSYSYTTTLNSDATEAATDVVSALATGTSWLSILIVVGFAVIVLSMLTSGLEQAATRDQGVPYY